MKQLRKSNAKYLLLLLVILQFICINCNRKTGFEVQRFLMNNTELDSLTELFITNLFKFDSINGIENQKRIPILIYGKNDSVITITFSYSNKKNISMELFRSNLRLLGYANNNYCNDILLLVSPNVKFSELGIFYIFTYPDTVEKNLDYLNFPNLIYHYDKVGENYYSSPIVNDDNRRFVYYYQNGRIIPKSKYSLF